MISYIILYRMEVIFMKFRLKDPASAITHGIAALLAVTGAIPLLLKGKELLHVFALGIFILSMILLYTAPSTTPFMQRKKSAAGCANWII